MLERFARIDWKLEPVRFIDGKSYALSSGELTFVKFAAQASLHIENGSLLLLDEPETHLHPSFISGFCSILNGLLRDTGSAAIIATHSAFFVREVFREQVIVLRVDDEGAVHSDYPRLRTFGGDVGAISFFVFGQESGSNLAQEVQLNLVESGLSLEEIEERHGGEFAPEFIMQLRRLMAIENL